MQIKAVYPGTFDPITNGHIDVAKRACKMFEKVMVRVEAEHCKRLQHDGLKLRVFKIAL